MISVIIPTRNSEATLGQCLSALVPAAVDGLVREVVIADGGSADQTLRIIDTAGADVVAAAPGLAERLSAGAQAARSRWLLFLPPEAMLTQSWEREAIAHLARFGDGSDPTASAAVFGFALEEAGIGARAFEAGMRAVTAALGYGSGGGGVLISRLHFQRVGGFDRYAPLPVVDLVRRIGRRRLVRFKSRLVYSTANPHALTRSVGGRAAELLSYRAQTAVRQLVRLGQPARA